MNNDSSNPQPLTGERATSSLDYDECVENGGHEWTLTMRIDEPDVTRYIYECERCQAIRECFRYESEQS